jgi:hypothetical protein
MSEVSTLPDFKLNKLLKTLNCVYGVTIDFENNISILEQVMEECKVTKQRILRECGFNSYNKNEEYTKATLIIEAITIYLVEIAPKRIPRQKTAA